MHLPALYFQMNRALLIQRLFLKKKIIPFLSELLQENDGSFDPPDLKKITDYYGLAVPAILGEAFCILHDRRMSSHERFCITATGSLSGLLDDFFDRKKLSDEYIQYLIDHPYEIEGKNTDEKIFLHFAGLALRNSSQPDKLKCSASLVFETQIRSRMQIDKSIDLNEITNITQQKGGEAFLFYLSAFDDIDDASMAIFFQLGALMQFENDLFDIFKDFQEDIYTLATTAKNLDWLKNNYDAWVKKLF